MILILILIRVTPGYSDTYGLPYALHHIIEILRLCYHRHHLERSFNISCRYTSSYGYQLIAICLLLVLGGLEIHAIFGDLEILEMYALPDNGRNEVAHREGADGAESRVPNGTKRQRIVWRNVILMGLLHAGALYSVLLIPKAHPFTWIWSYICFMITALGITAGAHRLWSHRSYNAKLPLRIFLAAANSMAFQNDIYEWSRDHRSHHKYSETDADPHNAKRGFFFSHVGWLFVQKHKDVIDKGKRLDLSDLLADPVVVFQRKYYKMSVLVMCFFLPTMVPWYFWGESMWNSYFLASILRYTVALNLTWLVNSAAHMYGNRPYNKDINPRENRFVTFGAIGEGFHNFHHTFPFDYAASEFGLRYNITTCFIDLMCWLGLASNRKKATSEMVMARKLRTGDGSA